MSDLIAWYTVELRSRLAPHLPLAEVNTIVLEAESHLKESVAVLVTEQQLTEELAASTAINSFGRPERVAMTHLGQNVLHPFGINPGWLIYGGAAVAILTWVIHWEWLRGFFDNFGETWQNGFAGVVGTLAVIAFGIGCYSDRKKHGFRILAAGAALSIGIIFTFSFLIVGANTNQQGLSRLRLSRDVSNVKANVVILDRLDAYIRQGAVAFARAKTTEDIPLRFRDPKVAQNELVLYDLPDQAAARHDIDSEPGFQTGSIRKMFLTPSDFVYAMVDGRVYGLQSEIEFSHAVLWWRRHESDALAAIAKERANMTLLLGAANQARSGRLFFFNPAVFGEALCWLIVFMPILFIIDAGVFILIKRNRSWPGWVKA